ncbi:MAG: hypothetical protein ACYTAS_17070, partial [Planctomycetota bacterium]
MRDHRIPSALLIVLVLLSSSPVPGAEAQQAVPQLNRERLPGRQVKVAAICIGFGGDHDTKLKLAIDHLHTAGRNGVDIACLP